ncbi:hypothetical protein [Sunxiuqinia sp. sy24]|uniref:hypothetical protein n=1 Tax=Sunxiuqinia sp. sy24 TaxID=3461495 RepID=UPI004045F15F
MATTAPNHQVSGYSTSCTECHSARAIDWGSANIEHNFFPLEGGHAIRCVDCHVSGTFEKISNDCFSCHQQDYNASQNPRHQELSFSTSCADCHSLNPGWEPAEFRNHDAQFFPIFSGKHRGEWNNCMDCHINSASYSEYSCIDCHEHSMSRMDDKHSDVNNYAYSSVSCLACHPQGNED